MKKGFKPTEHKKSFPKNLRKALDRQTKELKKALNNPMFIAAHLDTEPGHDVE